MALAVGRGRVHDELWGQHDHTVDDKGRLSIPADFRDTLGLSEGDEVVVTRHLSERCLRIYRQDAWGAFMAAVDAVGDPRGTRDIRRVVFGSARRMKVDRLGRISLPSALRHWARLDGKCFAVGQGQCVEIWDVKVWNETHDPEKFKDLDLSLFDM